jgi:hypothetical protein
VDAKLNAIISMLRPEGAEWALDRASPNFMGLIRLGLEIDTFCDLLYSARSPIERDFGTVFLRADPIPDAGAEGDQVVMLANMGLTEAEATAAAAKIQAIQRGKLARKELTQKNVGDAAPTFETEE